MTHIFKEKKRVYEYPENLVKSMEILKYFDNPIILAGSANLRSQMFFGDYDLISNIKKKESAKKSYYEFRRILKEAQEQNFLTLDEVKIQLTNGKKYREFISLEEFEKVFKDIELIKFDFLLYSDYVFYELSSIYPLIQKPLDPEENKKSLLGELPELKKEGKYYKLLKRIFSLSSKTGKSINLEKLTAFFNKNGEDYRKMSNLEAIEKIYKIDPSDQNLFRIKENLRMIGENASSISKKIESIKKSLQMRAKKFYIENFSNQY
jgi:hypothetical protein